MTDFGAWMPNPKAAVHYDGAVDEQKAQRMKFFAAAAVWLTLALDACISGVIISEGDLTVTGAFCAAGAITTASMLVLLTILALVWAGFP